MPYLGLITCFPVEVIDQSELQESLLAISKMTAEELAAYSKVQSLLGKIAKTPEEIPIPSNPHHSFNRVQQNRGPNSYPTVTRPYIPSIHEIKKANNNFQPPINLAPNMHQNYPRTRLNKHPMQRLSPKPVRPTNQRINVILRPPSYGVAPAYGNPIGPLPKILLQNSFPTIQSKPARLSNPDPAKMSASEIADFLGKLSGKEIKKEEPKVENEIPKEKPTNDTENNKIKVSNTYHKTLLGDYKFPDQDFKGFGFIKDEFEKDFLETIYEKPIEEIKKEEVDIEEKFNENESFFESQTSSTFYPSETDFVKQDIESLKNDLKSIKDGLAELSNKSEKNVKNNEGKLTYFIIFSNIFS